MSTEPELPVLLIVEDDEGLQRQLKWAYEGYRVVSAGDRSTAIEMMRLHEPIQEVLAREQPVLFTWGNRLHEAIGSHLQMTDGPINLRSRMWWWQLEKLTLAP